MKKLIALLICVLFLPQLAGAVDTAAESLMQVEPESGKTFADFLYDDCRIYGLLYASRFCSS